MLHELLVKRISALVTGLLLTGYAAAADISSADSLDANVAVFGETLFQGDFAAESVSGFNPDYLISVDDVIDINIWGAVEASLQAVVDAQGQIFLPRIGPVQVRNVRNADLNRVVRKEVKRIYRDNVEVYARLQATQPVKVFVTGFVTKPGLYPGLSSDSLVNLIDRAGGIDSARGSYLEVLLKRGERVVQRVNLYDFILNGVLAKRPLKDGDTIWVGPVQSTVTCVGLVSNENRFEFSGDALSALSLLALARPKAEATHLRIFRNRGATRHVEYIRIKDAMNATVFSGDRVEVVADQAVGTVIVGVTGEHDGPKDYVLPAGATLKDLLANVQLNDRSAIHAIQLYRKSIAKRQQEMLETSLRALETHVLTARSSTAEEASLRAREAELVMKFVDRARKYKTKGLLILGGPETGRDVQLKAGDIIHIPSKSQIVQIHGEVLYPTALVHQDNIEVDDYIASAGGFNQNADEARILIRRQNGEIVQAYDQGMFISSSIDVNPGDEILVLPKVELKTLQVTKDITQVIYQIAVASAAVLRFT